ncbi:hypothetical protein ABE504_12770 [Paenibacillus oryzisoli]|uniref:hypothetical protein n=1 Tax=Paenibacillus oryzisoli TaxID=1850517 RepID=UPI003D2BAF53
MIQSKLSKLAHVYITVFTLLFSFLIPIKGNMVHAAGTVYYVNSQSGNDSNSGTSSSSAWQTLSKVNSITFSAGDTILFAKGSSWTGQLTPKGSGTSAAQITIDAYGSGNLPIINGAGTMPTKQGTVYLLNQSYWTIRNLEVTNNAANNGNYRSGIMVDNNGGGSLSTIIIENNTIHHVVSNVEPVGIDPHKFGGISMYAQGTNDSFPNAIIRNNNVSYSDRVGIVFWDSSFQPRSSASASVSISNNNVSYAGGDSIILYGTRDSILDHNVGSYATNNPLLQASNKYSAGIFPTRSYDTTVQFNESYNTQFSGDGQGFDADILQEGAVFQYNYSHNNAGGGMLMMHSSLGGDQPADVSDITVRYNIFQNENGWGVLTFSQLATPERLKVYNNTIYQSSSSTAAIISNCTNGGYFVTGTTDMAFKNNIVYKLNTVDYFPPDASGVYDYNVFYGDHPSREPSDSHKITTDPKLVNPGLGQNGLNTNDGYKLWANSPALHSGVLITETYAPHNGNGGQDYWGNAVSSTLAPNRGAYNGSGIGLGKSWEFTSNTESFTAANVSGFGWQSGGFIGGTNGSSDPYIVSADNLGVNLTNNKIMKIKMKNSTTGTSGKIYFTTNSSTSFDEAKSKTFTVTANDGNYTEYAIDMSSVAGWTGTLKQLRLDPNSAASGSFSLDYIRISNGSLVQTWEFNHTIEGFVSTNVTSFGWQSSGTIGGTNANSDPYITSADAIGTAITSNKIIRIMMKNSTSGTGAKLYFTTTSSTGYDEAKSKSFTIKANDANYTEYILDMSNVPGWTGILKQIRLDPNSASSGSFSIDYIRISNS